MPHLDNENSYNIQKNYLLDLFHYEKDLLWYSSNFFDSNDALFLSESSSNANDEQLDDLEIDDDPLGLIDADETESEGDYKITSSQVTGKIIKENSNSAVGNSAHISEEQILTPPSSSNTFSSTTLDYLESEEDEELIEFGSTKSIFESQFVSDSEEKKLINNFYNLLTVDWSFRLNSAFNYYLKSRLQDSSQNIIESLCNLFKQRLSRFIQQKPLPTSFMYYYSQSFLDPLSVLYSYLAVTLINSSCSEVSCERVFSKAKWIVGDRRKKLSVKSLNSLLHIHYNSS